MKKHIIIVFLFTMISGFGYKGMYGMFSVQQKYRIPDNVDAINQYGYTALDEQVEQIFGTHFDSDVTKCFNNIAALMHAGANPTLGRNSLKYAYSHIHNPSRDLWDYVGKDLPGLVKYKEETFVAIVQLFKQHGYA